MGKTASLPQPPIPMSGEKLASFMVADEKPVPMAPEKPVPLMVVRENPPKMLLPNEKLESRLAANENPRPEALTNDNEGFISLTDLEAFHLKQCRNKVNKRLIFI